MFGNLTDNRKSRRRIDDAGVPFPPKRGKHAPYPGQFPHPEETYRFGSIQSRKFDQAPVVIVIKPNGTKFTPSPEFAKADHKKAVQM